MAKVKSIIGVILAGCVLIAMASCGGGSTTSSAPSEPAAPTTSAQATTSTTSAATSTPTTSAQATTSTTSAATSNPTTSAQATTSTTSAVTSTPTTSAQATTSTTSAAVSTTATTAATGSLTNSIFQTMESGTFHIKMVVLSGASTGIEAGMEIELYAKNGMMAMAMNVMGMDARMVIKDNKSYIIIDDFEMVLVSDASPEDEIDGLGSTSNMTYAGSGSGAFNGKTYAYDEYTDSDGGRFFYYVDGSTFKGMRTIIDGETVDIEIVSFDTNVPDGVFNIPADYTIM